MTEQRKNYILRDISDFVKMSISTLVITRLANLVNALAQKLVWISKDNFSYSFGALRLRAD